MEILPIQVVPNARMLKNAKRNELQDRNPLMMLKMLRRMMESVELSPMEEQEVGMMIRNLQQHGGDGSDRQWEIRSLTV